MKSSISIGENWRNINTKTKFTIFSKFKCVIVLVCRQFSPTLILLLKHSRKSEGVRKFLSEKRSYNLVYEKTFQKNSSQSSQLNQTLHKLNGKGKKIPLLLFHKFSIHFHLRKKKNLLKKTIQSECGDIYFHIFAMETFHSILSVLLNKCEWWRCPMRGILRRCVVLGWIEGF